MGIAVVFGLLLLAAGIVVYPLISKSSTPEPSPSVTDGDIEQAMRDLRLARSQGEFHCPQCGRGYQAGDRFCVRCGKVLPDHETASPESSCPSCGAGIREDDLFCAKCGHRMSDEEAA